jgi:hypothetical protein
LFVSLLLIRLATPGILGAAEGSDSSSQQSSPLSVDAVVDNLVERDHERAQALQSAESTRVYHLVYSGFPGFREAEMTVRARYWKPATKDFEVLSQNGSKLIVDRVFKKLLEGEQEAANPEVRDHSALNRSNYDFRLLRYEPSERGGQYVLQVTPKSKNRYVYRGQIWVDGTDFAVTRIQAEPVENPSFWTKRSRIYHEYEKVQGFWVPIRNESVSFIRLGGRATLTIEYKDYHLKTSANAEAASLSPARQSPAPAILPWSSPSLLLPIR